MRDDSPTTPPTFRLLAPAYGGIKGRVPLNAIGPSSLFLPPEDQEYLVQLETRSGEVASPVVAVRTIASSAVARRVVVLATEEAWRRRPRCRP
jgi:hypothetical protein